MYAISTPPTRWYCATCQDTHDGDVVALHVAQVRAQHDGSDVTINVFGCAIWPPDMLHRAAARVARELTASLREGA